MPPIPREASAPQQGPSGPPPSSGDTFVILERLARMDERLIRALADIQDISRGMVRREDLNALDSRLREVEASMVTRDEFEPVKKAVYGAIALILTTVVGALIALVVRGGAP